MNKRYPIVHFNSFMYAPAVDHAEIGDYFHNRLENRIEKAASGKINTGKVVASNDPALELPMLPDVEEDINQLAEDNCALDTGINRTKWIKGFVTGYKAASKKQYSKEDIMTWYKYVKTHTVKEAFTYLESLKPKPIAVELDADFNFIKYIYE